jgi:branched-subunit amino acid aminotransferase/4-amino-4-deoxychorismate lyase
MPFVNHNGLIHLQDEAIIHIQSRALRFGEGLIETMFFYGKTLRHFDFHYERLCNSLKELHFPPIEKYTFEKELARTIIANQNPEKGILRAEFFLNESAFELQFWIEFIPVKDDHGEWRSKGLLLGISNKVVKCADSISHLKSCSRLLYIIAKQEAIQLELDDILICNPDGNLVECTHSNIFIVKSQNICTPPLSEGCVNGVMRRFLLEKKEIEGIAISEKIITKEALADADEVFLTNAVRGLQPVGSINGKVYSNNATRYIFDLIAEK